jgi:7-cyano-7-deazaguanine synthase
MSAATSQSEPSKDRTCLVVFSGGQDSTTCLHWALGRFGAVETVFFDYGQRHAAEYLAAAAIAARLSVPLKVFRLDFFREMGGNALVDQSIAIEAMPESGGLPNTFVPGRNLIFLTYAASYAFTRGIRDLVTGVCQTDYSGYPDCRDATIKSLEQALGQGLGWIESGKPPTQPGGFAIHTPLMFKTKAESVRWAAELGALESLAYSHTCYEGAFPPCGKCPACLLRKKGFEEAGVPDPLEARAAGRG